MYRLSLIVSICLLGIASLGAGIPDNAGQYGYQFLDVSTNPVALALAGRGIHSPNAAASFIHQPASGALNAHRSMGASYTAWLADINYNNLYYSYSTRKQHFGLAMRVMDYGSLENRDDAGAIIGTYSPLDLDLMANYAVRIVPSLYVGANAGVVYEKLNSDSSLGVHTDLGLTWLPPLKNTSLSASARNLGLSTAMNEVKTKFSPSFELDMGHNFRFNRYDIMLEAGGFKAVNENWKASVSAEFGFYDQLALLRLGYKINHDAEDLSAGFGLRWKNIGVDYGWAMFSDRLSDVHSVGLSYNF